MKAINDKKILRYTTILSWLVFINFYVSTLANEIKEIKLKLVQDVELNETPGSKMTFFHSLNTPNPVPKVDVFDNKVIFYNEAGEQIAQEVYNYPIEVYKSENQKYLQIVYTIQNPSKKYTGKRRVEFFYTNGKKFLEKTIKINYDFPSPYFSISNNGLVVKLDPSQGNIEFFNNSGQVIRKIDIYHQTSETEIGFKVKFSRDGLYLVIGVTYPQTVAPVHTSSVMMFDALGKEIWRFSTDQLNISDIFISPDNSYIACSSFDHGMINQTTYILDGRTGEKIFRQSELLAREVRFLRNKNDRRQIIAINNKGNQLVYIDINNKQIVHTHSMNPEEKILALETGYNNQFLAIVRGNIKYILKGKGQKRVFEQPSIQFYDFSGKFLGEEAMHLGNMDYIPDEHFKILDKKMILYLQNQKRLIIFELREMY